MEAIIFLVIGALVMYFFIKKSSQKQEAQTIEEATDQVSLFIHYKKRILRTSAYDEESTYRLLYDKITDMTWEALEKHDVILTPFKVWDEIEFRFDSYFEIEDGDWRIKRSLDTKGVSDQILLTLALVSFSSRQRFEGKKISRNEFFANRAIEYLIEERHYWPASLAKGLILKYGFKPYRPPCLDQSAISLKKIATHYPPVYDEINELERFRELETSKYVHHQPRFEDEWNPHEAIEQQIKGYHMLNVNG